MTLRLILLLCSISLALTGMARAEQHPKLVVLMVVDQLRGDMPLRLKDRFGPGGFRRLMDEGAYFTRAHYRHSSTFTAVGHATIATGGNPAEHGIVANRWHDRASGASMYCTGDDRHRLVGIDSDKGGRSPANLLIDTVGDAWVDATGGKARVFSLAIKDRAAVLLGGHKGKAFWYAENKGRYISSTYYFDSLPQWVEDWNETDAAGAYRDTVWKLLRDPSVYEHLDDDDRSIEFGFKHLGRTFPHILRGRNKRDFYSALRVTPFGDQLTLAFAKKILEEEGLGRGEKADILCVGLSSSDYIGHQYGPGSLEVEDNLLRLDANLAEFFSYLDGSIGMDEILVILTSDHGVDGVPRGSDPSLFPAGYLDVKVLIAQGNKALRDAFGTTEDLIKTFSIPYFYLDQEALEAADIDLEAAQDALAKSMRGLAGVAYAVPSHLIESGDLPSTAVNERIKRSYHPNRSGDVTVIQDQYWQFMYGRPLYTATHGSPYGYDTHVPMVFMGPGIEAAQIDRPVGPEDIAPTLAAYLGIDFPAVGIGETLAEIVE